MFVLIEACDVAAALSFRFPRRELMAFRILAGLNFLFRVFDAIDANVHTGL